MQVNWGTLAVGVLIGALAVYFLNQVGGKGTTGPIQQAPQAQWPN